MVDTPASIRRVRALIVAAVVAVSGGLLPGLPAAAARAVVAGAQTVIPAPGAYQFGTAEGGQSPTPGIAVVVQPVVANLPDGSVQTTYGLPDGGIITTTTPPPGFDPMTADASLLQELAFPARPSDPIEAKDWTTAMSAYASDEPPTGPLTVVVAGSAPSFSTIYGTPWAGYTVGSWTAQSHTYVAVKDVFTVPTDPSTCSYSANQMELGMWVGLGGTAHTNDLVQQGLECGNTDVGSGTSYRPFVEFCCQFGASAQALCGYTSWTFPTGHVIYQNMSFQTSTNKAFFYLQDETTGVAHSCSRTPPSGWAWDLNTAEWISEAPTGGAPNFGSVRFTDAHAELSSNSSWVTIGSQAWKEVADGYVSPVSCISPGSLGSDSASFTDTWHQQDCGFP